MGKTTKSADKRLEADWSDSTRSEVAAAAATGNKSPHVRAPDLKLDFDNDTRKLIIGYKDADTAVATALAMHELGSVDTRFYDGVMEQVAALGCHGSAVSETSSNFVMSVVAGVQPTDELEAMLAIQMGAVHQATMMMARRLKHCETLPQQHAAERALNKLARTFTRQMEVLKRYRSKADQTVRVERVEVREGGQAIVGNIRNDGGGQ